MIVAASLFTEAFAQRLAAHASALARARAEGLLLERRGDPARWHKARLLWPLFTGD